VDLGAIDVNWGSVPDWVAGVGTVIAIAVALWLALRETRLRRIADKDDEKRRARLVIVGEPSADTSQSTPGATSLYATVYNYGHHPIHEVIIGLQRGGSPLPPAQYIQMDFIGPGEKREVEFEVPQDQGSLSSNRPELWFLDSFGRRWKRSAGDPEPQRVLEYVDPSLPAEIRALIESSRAEPRRRSIRFRLRRSPRR
jgi:hypothetical protein